MFALAPLAYAPFASDIGVQPRYATAGSVVQAQAQVDAHARALAQTRSFIDGVARVHAPMQRLFDAAGSSHGLSWSQLDAMHWRNAIAHAMGYANVTVHTEYWVHTQGMLQGKTTGVVRTEYSVVTMAQAMGLSSIYASAQAAYPSMARSHGTSFAFADGQSARHAAGRADGVGSVVVHASRKINVTGQAWGTSVLMGIAAFEGDGDADGDTRGYSATVSYAEYSAQTQALLQGLANLSGVAHALAQSNGVASGLSTAQGHAMSTAQATSRSYGQSQVQAFTQLAQVLEAAGRFVGVAQLLGKGVAIKSVQGVLQGQALVHGRTQYAQTKSAHATSAGGARLESVGQWRIGVNASAHASSFARADAVSFFDSVAHIAGHASTDFVAGNPIYVSMPRAFHWAQRPSEDRAAMRLFEDRRVSV